ncbi:MAG: hypothetical protein WCE64_07960 [Bacteroidales bacterium]
MRIFQKDLSEKNKEKLCQAFESAVLYPEVMAMALGKDFHD